jgi:hypothetical protein
MPMKFASMLVRLAFAPLPGPPGVFALPLRLIVGYGFLAHGFAKLARGPDHFIAILHAIGMPFSFFLGWATIVIEVIGGALILCGAFVPLASIPMRRAHGCDRHRPSSQRLQLDQAHRLRFVGRAFRPARLRDRPPLSRRSACPLIRRRRAVFRRWLPQAAPRARPIPEKRQAARMARGAAPQLAIAATIRSTPRAADRQ